MSDRSASGAPEQSVPSAPIQMTVEGRGRLATELARLTKDERPALARRVQRERLFLAPAVSTGASSVAEYELSILDQHIKQLTDLLDRVQVIPEPPDVSTVQVGSRVTVRYDDGTEETLTIVGLYEADPSRGQVSSGSPAGRALLGKVPGDKVLAGTDDDALMLTVASIDKQEVSLTIDTPGLEV